MTHNVQKGLQPVKALHPEIDVTEDSFGDFLTWMLDNKGVTSTDLVNIVTKPHHYIKEWEEYYETR